MIPLLILDVDGVMTDGTKIYDVNGNVTGKRFCDKDFTAIRRAKESGKWNVCWLSGDRKVNEAIAKQRDIDFYYASSWPDDKNKEDYLVEFELIYAVDINNMYYIGDDYYDLGIMKALPKSNVFCPRSAAKCVKNYCYLSNIIPENGGEGAVEDFLSYKEFFEGTEL